MNNFRVYIFTLLISSLLFISCNKTSSGDSSTPVTPVVPVTPPAEKPYQLVWSDEFDTDGLVDTSKWAYEEGGNGWGNNELQYYTRARSENARVSGGNLVIEARKENFSGKSYTSARLITKKKAQWTYGKFEIKAKIPRGRGTWPAIWLLSANDILRWPDDGELDIMEAVGYLPNLIHGTAHNKLYNGANGKQKGDSKLIPDAQDAFHVYSLEWNNSVVTWSIDGVVFYAYYDPALGLDAWPYNKDFFMILNLAIGGNWGGVQGIDDSIFPQSMLIDYVRVYQRK